MAKLRITGAWVGVLEVELDKWTVPMLKDELAKRSNSAPNFIKLICAGQELQESPDNPNLAEIGVRNNARVLVIKTQVDKGSILLEAEKQRSARIARNKRTVSGLAKLDIQSGPVADFLSEIDQSFSKMGNHLTSQGEKLIRRRLYTEAIQSLALGEEAFSFCGQKFMENKSNGGLILQLGMVWSYLMLRDTRFIPDAVARLPEARKVFQLTNWKDPSSDLDLCLMLKLSEGIASYYHDRIEECRILLNSAKENSSKVSQLQLYNEALSLLKSMGYKETEAKRAPGNQDVERETKEAENIERRKAIKSPVLEMFESFDHEGDERAAEAVSKHESYIHKRIDSRTQQEAMDKLLSSMREIGSRNLGFVGYKQLQDSVNDFVKEAEATKERLASL